MVHGRITKTHLDVVQMMLITMQKKIFQKFPKLWIFAQSKVLKLFSTSHAYAYTYEAQNFFVGVIFDCKQDGPKKLFNIEIFGFFRNKIWDPPHRKYENVYLMNFELINDLLKYFRCL